jgi:DNA-directed RNA polymerase II subunit RPB2
MTSDSEIHSKEIPDSEIPWILIESYFKHKHLKQLVKHQLESYNYFVNNQIQQTIEMFNPLIIASEHDFIKELNLYRLEIEITFENFSIYRPQIYENNGSTKIMFPQEARLRNFSYSSAMTIDLNIKYIIRNGENYKNVLNYQKKIKNVHIGKLPIMLKSDLCVLNQYKHLNHNETGECYMDPGGYFIINGSEKTCISQERAAENQIYCYNIEKNNNKWSWKAEMKCIPDWKCISPKQISILIASRNNGYGNALYLQIPRVKIPIPLFIMFRAFNIISDKEICELIMLNITKENMKKMLISLKASIIEGNKVVTQEAAIRYIVANVIYTPMNMDKETGSKKKHDFAIEVLNNDIFPHCKTEKQKIYMLGYMTNILLQTSFGWLLESDRDSYVNKRVDLTGPLLNNLLRNYFNKLVKDMKKQIIREINTGSWKSNDDYENIITKTNIYKIIKSTTIEQGIKRALATGDFGIKQINSNKVGVAQVLNRLTYLSSLSHLRRVNTPIDKSGKLVPPRRLHNSTWGFLCPAETPEGQSIGIVKNLAYLAHITINSNSSGLYDYILPIIDNIDSYNGSYKDLDDYVKVFINGSWVGITNEIGRAHV